MDQIFNYYAMIRNGYFLQSTNRPNGFDYVSPEFAPGSNIPSGIIADRHWKSLTGINPRWREDLSRDYSSNKVLERFSQGILKPMVFTDVDFALIDRDAQGHIDQYVVDRATLEALGFIAQYYEELRDPNIQLADIRGSASIDRSFELGQDLFHSSLTALARNNESFIPASFVSTLAKIMVKKPGELTNKDFQAVLTNVDDAFYVLIVNPLGDYVNAKLAEVLRDSQAGQDRMKLVYTTIAAFSHSQIEDADEMLRHRSFSEFNADEHLYPGVRDFFQASSTLGLEVVAITRGNQFPYMEGSGSGIDDLFDRVHSTLIASRRSKQDRDPLYPDKKIRSYSLEIDNMSTDDKVRIMFHETLQMFARKGMDFRSSDEIYNAVATYLDHCVFITDSDLQAWGTCPTVCVLALRTPTRRDVDNMFAGIESLHNPIAIVNPLDRNDPLLGLDSKDVFSTFDPYKSGLGDMLADMALGKNLQRVYSADPGFVQRGQGF